MISLGRLYTIIGRVQGVGFRHFTYRTALGMGIVGYVKNLSNGNVEVYVQNQDEALLNRFEERLTKGPSFARVQAVQSVEEKKDRHYCDFIIE